MPTVAVALETYQREDIMLENTLASVVPTVKACYIALGTCSMRLTSGLVYGFHAGELYSIFGLKRGFLRYRLIGGHMRMECTSHCFKDTSGTVGYTFTVFTPSHVPSKGDA